jgi:hypothetical protein
MGGDVILLPIIETIIVSLFEKLYACKNTIKFNIDFPRYF